MATETVKVEVKSAWLSKINWLQILGLIMTAITTNVLGLDAATQVKVLAISNVVQNVATIVIKTWFTPTVTAASVEK